MWDKTTSSSALFLYKILQNTTKHDKILQKTHILQNSTKLKILKKSPTNFYKTLKFYKIVQNTKILQNATE